MFYMFILKIIDNFFKGKMMRKAGMNPKTLQYLMGHSDISVTMNVYTHVNFDDAEEELYSFQGTTPFYGVGSLN